jgi:uncharacterized protein YndB with AHSA1/START domain
MSETEDRAAVVIERTFAAPVEQIWAMWTVPELFASWYGPTGATIPMAQMDLRVGGVRLVCMEMSTPNGPMTMWFTGEFLDVVEPERLVYTEVLADERGRPLDAADVPGGNDVTEVRVELAAVDGGTHMVMTHVGIPAGSPGEAGWTMAIDKLEQVLAG